VPETCNWHPFRLYLFLQLPRLLRHFPPGSLESGCGDSDIRLSNRLHCEDVVCRAQNKRAQL